MRRREFITLLGGATTGAAICPLAARAQKGAKVPRIGYLGYSPRAVENSGIARAGDVGARRWDRGRALPAVADAASTIARVGSQEPRIPFHKVAGWRLYLVFRCPQPPLYLVINVRLLR